MIGRLNNSHSGYLPPSDRAVFFHFLPFAFERVSGRVFVTVPGRKTGLNYADEVLTIDGESANTLRAPVRNYLVPRRGNPYYGPKDSTAVVKLAGGRTVALRRVRTLEPKVESIRLPSGFVAIRLLALDSEVERALDSLLSPVTTARGMVLDLRYCGGGVPASGLNIASWLLGPAKIYNTIVPRNASGSEDYGVSAPSGEAIASIVERGPRARLRTHEPLVSYTGPLAVLISGNTGSECEVLASVLQEHGRARFFGTTTEGAFNGWSQARGLPHGAGSISIPITAAISSKGIEYEGRGVVPDEIVAASPDDFQKHRDPAREQAAAWLRDRIQ
jgi:C-terminal processing protease CtpA/Prc